MFVVWWFRFSRAASYNNPHQMFPITSKLFTGFTNLSENVAGMVTIVHFAGFQPQNERCNCLMSIPMLPFLHFKITYRSMHWAVGQSSFFFLEKCLKLYGEPWAKRWVHTNFYRIRTMFDHVSKALKVPGLVGISRIWGHSEPHTCGQMT